jgi:hypothetical protein
VRIVRPLTNPERAWNIHRQDEHGKIVGIEGRMEEGTYDDIIEEFKQLESMLAYSVEIRRLDWQCPTVSLMPDTPEESKRVDFWNFRTTFTPRSQPQFARASELKAIVKNMALFEPLTVVQAFWREGRNEMEQMRYIPAFINYFYVLEALYANGRFGKREVLLEFEKSDDLRTFAESFLKSPTMKESPHRENLLQMLEFRQKSRDVPGLLYVLVETRGEVHHYVPTKRRHYGTPFRNHEYHTVALAADVLQKRLRDRTAPV